MKRSDIKIDVNLQNFIPKKKKGKPKGRGTREGGKIMSWLEPIKLKAKIVMFHYQT
jgi:hypothetical protein